MNATTFTRKFAVIGIAVAGMGFAASIGNVAHAIGVGELQECTISKSMDMAVRPATRRHVHPDLPGSDDGATRGR